MTTQIVKWGNSQGIRLPKQVLESADIQENDMVEIKAEEACIIITKIEKKKPHRTLSERFEGYDGSAQVEEYDWGKSIGKEVW